MTAQLAGAPAEAELVDLRAVPDSLSGLALDGVGRVRIGGGAWIPLRVTAGYDLARAELSGVRLRPITDGAAARDEGIEATVLELVNAQVSTRLASEFPLQSREVVLLAHQPRAVVEAERAGVGLTISGHTHGGQIWPFNFLVRLQQPVTSGLVRFGRSLIYVSNGTGYWGPPMRLGSPAEITQLVLEARPARPAPGVP